MFTSIEERGIVANFPDLMGRGWESRNRELRRAEVTPWLRVRLPRVTVVLNILSTFFSLNLRVPAVVRGPPRRCTKIEATSLKEHYTLRFYNGIICTLEVFPDQRKKYEVRIKFLRIFTFYGIFYLNYFKLLKGYYFM